MLKMKCILTLALVALCVTAMAVPAMALAGDDVVFVEDDTDLPTEMVPGSEYDAAITIENTGSNDWTGDGTLDGYSLWAYDGPTIALLPVDRWGMDGVAVEEDAEIPWENVEDDDDAFEDRYAFEPTLVAPPWITLAYDDSIGATEPPVADSFECGWMMSDGSAVFGNDKATSDVVLDPFTDVESTGYGEDEDEPHWAWAQIAQCSATATESSNFIVQGYGDDTYQPAWEVTRAQMAVFIARAAGYTDEIDIPLDDDDNPYRWVSFKDVPTSYWAFNEIERCVLNEVVKGYADYFEEEDLTPEKDTDAYLPGNVVDRGQMAVYISRAAGEPTIAYEGLFEDVDDEFWAVLEIEACARAEIVQGYGAGIGYLPNRTVNRAQMAMFVWRALVRDVESDVVLAGPGALDPARHAFMDPGTSEQYAPGTADYYGWSVADLEDDEADNYIPGVGAIVYIVLDGVRVGAGDVDFRVYHIEYDDVAEEDVEVDDATGSQTLSNQTATVEAAGGNCYYAVTYKVPDTLTSDEEAGDDEDYIVEITLPQGAVFELGFAVEQ